MKCNKVIYMQNVPSYAYQPYRPINRREGQQETVVWKAPAVGFYKANFDTANRNNIDTGISLIVPDQGRNVIAATSLQHIFLNLLGSKEAEVAAFRWAIITIAELCLTDVIF